MKFERNPEQAAVADLHAAIAAVADPALQFTPEQKKRLQVSLAMLEHAVEQATVEPPAPTFHDYVAARSMAYATGSVKVTQGGVTFVRAEDTHRAYMCTNRHSESGVCALCLAAYRDRYQSGGVVNTVSGDVSGTVVQAGNLGRVEL